MKDVELNLWVVFAKSPNAMVQSRPFLALFYFYRTVTSLNDELKVENVGKWKKRQNELQIKQQVDL